MKSEGVYSKECACVRARVCLFWFSHRHFGRESAKGYFDEQIARLQSVTVNKQTAYDIISPFFDVRSVSHVFTLENTEKHSESGQNSRAG